MPLGSRVVSDDENRLTFSLPISVLNADHVETGNERLLSLAIKVGEDDLWTANHNIAIGESKPVPAEDVSFATITSVVDLFPMKISAFLFRPNC